MSTSNSGPGSRRSSNASSSHGRPVPVLPPELPANENTESSGATGGQPLDEDSDGDTRLHHPSSNSRTQFTSQTPAAERAAIQGLRTKMTFSDHSAPSSTASTPNKSQQPPFPSQHLIQGAMTDPSKLQQPSNRLIKAKKLNSAQPQLTGALADEGGEESEEDSEGEIQSSVTISALLSKLDSVRNFLKEAETLHKRFQDRASEPGVAEQLTKLEILIAELKEQEASHLSVLLAVMSAGELKGGDIDKKDLELSEDEEEDSENDQSSGDSEEETPTNQTFVVKGAKSDDSLSLRAQIDKQRELNKEKAQDLVVLRQQQELLKKLIAQQKQIQDLEMRQAALLKLKRHAEEQIAVAEAKTAELEELSDAKQKEGQGEGEPEQLPEDTAQAADEKTADDDDRVQDLEQEETLNNGGSEPVSAAQEKLLLIKLAELRARKQRVEQLVGLLSAMRLQDEMTAAATGSSGASPLRLSAGDQEEPAAGGEEEELLLQAAAKTEADDDDTIMIGLSAEATGDGGSGPSELVHDDEATGMAELQDRLRKAEEARKKLRELQTMISQLHDLSSDDSEAEEEHTAPPRKFHWRDDSGRGRVGVVSSDGEESDDEEEAEGTETMNTTLTEDLDPAERSMVEQYEHRLASKRQEVIELQRQRDELRKTHARLVLLQSQILTPKGEEVKAKPSTKGQSRKTKGDEKALLDTTNATWGGSTVTEEGEKSPGSSVSLPSAILVDLTHHDSTLPTASAFAGSASVEQSGALQGNKPPFKVTRHTPRNVPTQHLSRMRNISSASDQTQRKKRKLDTSKASWKPDPQEMPRPTNPNPYSTAYFKSPQQQQQQQLHQSQQQPAPPQLDASHMTTDSTHYHASMMYSQLVLTSNMCSELLHTQNSLISVMSSHLEMFRYQAGIHQHYSALCHYQKELEQYYQDLYRSYSQMFQQQADVEEGHFSTAAGAQTDPEDPVMGSANEQQFEVARGSTGIASSPTAAVSSGGGGASQKERSGGDGDATTPRMPPPPPPLSSQPLPFLFHGGGYHTEQQQTGAAADISFATESADTAVNTSGANIPAPPIPPPTFNPYSASFRSPYHMNPYTDSSPMSRPVYGSGAPLPLGSSFAPSFPHGHFSNSPQLRPNHLPGYPYRSPMSYPPHHYHHPPQQWGDRPPSPGAAMFGGSGHHGPPPLGQFAPPFLPPHRVSPYHLPPLAHPPFGGHAPPPGFNIGQPDGSGLGGNVRPSTLLPSQAQLRSGGGPLSKVAMDDGLGLRSPSGTTAASLQVQPPSSPPSIPSINLQQPSTSNVNNCNAASVAMPNLGETTTATTTNFSTTGMTATLPTPTTAGGTTLQIPAFSPTVGAISTPVLGASNSAASSTLELGPGPGPGPDTASSFPTLIKPVDFNKEMGAASLMAWKGQALGDIPTGPVTTTAEMIVKRAEQRGGGAEGGRQPSVPVPVEKEESESSLPVSIPEELSHLQLDTLESELLHSEQQGEGGALTLSDLPSGFSVFDALRDTIYSEVATLIANNEARPHFLVELFRELQMLTTDYLRQRALYNLQDLVTRFLTEEGVAKEAKAATATSNMFQGWTGGSVSEHTPSESGATTEEESSAAVSSRPPPGPGPGPAPPLNKSNSQKYDYVEPVHSASSLSTPPNSSFSDEPFALESLGATAICLGKTMAKIKGEVAFGSGGGGGEGEGEGEGSGLKPPLISPGPLRTGNEFTIEDVNTDQLDELIKVIMIEVIPILKENLDSICTAEILAQIKQTIMNLIKEQEDMSENQGIFEAFTKQLETAIDSTADKYHEKRLKECGEDMLVDMSEVLFNELTFFRLLKSFKGHPQLSSELTSQSGTENEEEEEREGEDNKTDQSQPAAATAAGGDTLRPLDPTLLQALSLVANANLAEEEEALGKSRDDELATSWDTKLQERDRLSASADEDIIAIAKVVELSLSESQPFNSTGSGEEDELEDTGIDSFVIIDSVTAPSLPTSSTGDGLGETSDTTTPTPTHSSKVHVVVPNSEPEGQSSPPPPQAPVEKEEAQSAEQRGKEGVVSPGSGDCGEAPPTPRADESSTAQSETAADSGSIRSGGDEDKAMDDDGSHRPKSSQESKKDSEEGEKIEQTSGIGVEEGEGRREAVSPPASGPLGQQAGLMGINEAVLEAQMKVEQQSTEGVAGILSSIDESGPIDLVGDENELCTPTPGNVEP